MPKDLIAEARKTIQENYLVDEAKAIKNLIAMSTLTVEERIKIARFGAGLVSQVRSTTKPSLMEAFLAEYGLSTKEGLSLMSLAETLLRVPDSRTIDELIEDKISGGDWGNHAGHSISNLVNVSTMGLQVTNAVLKEGKAGVALTLQTMVKRLGMPVIRQAVKQVMKELGNQFVLGENITMAMSRADFYEAKGFTYSYDMLGEAAHTSSDAKKYYDAYSDAIESLSGSCKGNVNENPGVSIKLSALHPRYEMSNKRRVMAELVPRVMELAIKAHAYNMGFNIDAEEADLLDLSLSVIENVLSSKELEGWNGFGVVIQAYGRRAPYIIDWIYALSEKFNRKIMVRLVKGAYWDAEIKRCQVLGLKDFSVFTQKSYSDISYIACAHKLFGMIDRIYPQFATHNAHTVAAVKHFGRQVNPDQFEFQRLHGMGESLYEVIMRENNLRCRIYAPVGVHRDLLAYLVRRLLENGANSSFVNQIVDTAIPPTQVSVDPFEVAKVLQKPFIKKPLNIFCKGRLNSKGWDITDEPELDNINEGRDVYKTHYWKFDGELKGKIEKVLNPADPSDIVGEVTLAIKADCDKAFKKAKKAFKSWSKTSQDDRSGCLEKAADLLEENSFELFSLATREAGKSLPDSISEVREAVDFLRYYAKEARQIIDGKVSRGVFVCISPWNFPLAIFIGQVSAALVTGNTVLAKPAEQTTLIALRAAELLYRAGVPKDVLQVLPGKGSVIGTKLTSNKALGGVCFTGSTNIAKIINRVMAKYANPEAPLIAETGGLNAMIVDSTALPEQAIKDIVASSFQSAGQRCSALRILYIQKDVKRTFLKMLYGAMDELSIGDPWNNETDIGPVIDDQSKTSISQYSNALEKEGKLLKRIDVPSGGSFVSPTLFEVDGINDLKHEVFGPILHVATFKAKDLRFVLEDINSRGFGLTLGLHTRIEDRMLEVQNRAKVGNLYVNRNQVGAVVGCQPFGGEGLSGTGPKAGGPNYLNVFQAQHNPMNKESIFTSNILSTKVVNTVVSELCSQSIDLNKIRLGLRSNLAKIFPKKLYLIEKYIGLLEKIPDKLMMPSPVGESNELSYKPKGVVWCEGDGSETLLLQIMQSLYFGNRVLAFSSSIKYTTDNFATFPVMMMNGVIPSNEIEFIKGINLVAFNGQPERMKMVRRAMAKRE
ncbi:MAG: bifunctional proline dehydrogenase/L-glutamate gamma-semialdehyde dehydrogenase PutA, partial [Sphingomonadales bacterium]